MDHIAIMNKKWKLIEKILNGKKTIESRWYVNKIAPWDKIKIGDKIYFKNAGEPIIAMAEVNNVIQFKISEINLDNILKQYGDKIAFSTPIEEVKLWLKDKNYGILISLINPVKIIPFNINKSGFGISAAWLCVENIEKITIHI